MFFPDLIILITLSGLSFLNILVPISGSATVTPILAILTEPHKAVALAAVYFLLSGPIRVFLFRKNIQWDEIKKLLPVSIVSAALGALLLLAIPSVYLLVIIFIFTIYFLYKKIKNIRRKQEKKVVAPKGLSWFVGLFSGFLQGAGLSGSDLRNGYLYRNNLKIEEVHGTTALIGFSNFFIATIIRLFTDQISLAEIWPMIFVLPFVFIGTMVGRKVIYSLNRKVMNIIIVITMIAVLVLLAIKIADLGVF